MLIYPNFNPIALQIGPLSIHWYGLSYLGAFLLFLWLSNRQIKKYTTWMTHALLDQILVYGILGVILGGRLGYVCFYKPTFYWSHPLKILALWEGGMSFHGGFIGVAIAMLLFARHAKQNFWHVADFIAPLIPPGLASGRLGNFINGELWGKVTSPDVPWAMIFPHANTEDYLYAMTHPQWISIFNHYHALPRHPSQLYECVLEGLLLFAVLQWYVRQPRQMGQISGVFMLGYGLLRYVIEYAREPDTFLPALSFGLSMGQWLSLPMMMIGLLLLVKPYWNKKSP